MWIVLVVVVFQVLGGCAVEKMETEKIGEIEYTIVKEVEQPEEIRILIADNYETKMKMSYIDQGMEYIIIGYGEQTTSGYSIEVVEIYETENTVCVDTSLLGPLSGEEIVEVTTYPYIVIAIEENEKPVVYE